MKLYPGVPIKSNFLINRTLIESTEHEDGGIIVCAPDNISQYMVNMTFIVMVDVLETLATPEFGKNLAIDDHSC